MPRAPRSLASPPCGWHGAIKGPQERFDGRLTHDTVGANKFQPDEHDFFSEFTPLSCNSSPKPKLAIYEEAPSSCDAEVGGSRRVLARGNPRGGRDRHPDKRLPDSRAASGAPALAGGARGPAPLCGERRLPPTNGLYEDFRAVIRVGSEEGDPTQNARHTIAGGGAQERHPRRPDDGAGRPQAGRVARRS